MLLEKGSQEKKTGAGLVVGYDLGNYVSQISYGFVDGAEPETLSTVAGGESYNIPTKLAKRFNVNQWFYGKDAVKAAQEEEGTLVENLLALARRKEPVEIEGSPFDPAAMLALFMKRTMSLLTSVAPIEKIEIFIVTVDSLDRETIDILNRAVAGIGLKTDRIYFQSYMESFYYYIISQPEELWRRQVMLYDFTGDYLKVYRMECNRRTKPVVAFIDEQDYDTMYREEFPEEEEERKGIAERMDARFSGIVQEAEAGRIISAAYLIGEGFRGEWTAEALKLLCRNKRVFQGNNLYSKGACYSALERITPSENGKTHVFLGNDKLKSNIGMRVLRRGEESYLAILDAGINWFEAKKECEFILESQNTVAILVTPLNGREIKEIILHMDGLIDRPEKTTRVHLKMYMNGEHEACVELTDYGFGELFPGTGQVWKEQFEV